MRAVFDSLNMTYVQTLKISRCRTIIPCFLKKLGYKNSNSFRTYSNQKSTFALSQSSLINYLDHVKSEYWALHTAETLDHNGRKRLAELSPIVKVLEERECIEGNIRNLEDISKEDEKEMRELIAEERQVYERILKQVEAKLLSVVLPSSEGDNINKIVLEITAGVGGKEAMLFARELFDMYCGYMDYKGWTYQIAEFDSSEHGGMRHASLLINGHKCFRYLSHEAGVHRVQRVPATEKSGRIHTSTASIAVLPQPEAVDIDIQAKDLRIETKRAGGAGGQHVNTTDSAVRIVHIPSGLAIECQTDRSQIKNREIAMDRLRAKLYEKQITSQEATVKGMRKSQVGTSMRNEKIRTYNYNQDRITDHRLSSSNSSKGNMYNIKTFMEGGEPLQRLIDNLDLISREELLMKLIESVEKTNTKKR